MTTDTIATIAYARDADGELRAFEVEAKSYGEAIEAVKEELGVSRAMCVVHKKCGGKGRNPNSKKKAAA
ncbi:MAG: hypothetical protein FWF12_00385 [Betaproteobacteria bacterium]|nr:hypothetical protein [Betaproteobacteria bacterium]